MNQLTHYLFDLPREVVNTVWVFLAGSVLTLFRSIVDGTRRSAKSLVIGCLFGGLGATVAFDMFEASEWQVFWAGCAAVIAENFVVGLYNASKRFREHPIDTARELWGTFAAGLTVKDFSSRKSDEDPKDQ